MDYKASLSDANISRLQNPNELIGEIVSEFNESEQTLGLWKQKVTKYYELYQLVQKKKHYEGLANIFVPEILRAVETVVAKLYGLIFSQPDWYSYAGRDDNMDEGPAVALTKLVGYQMDENGFKSRVMDSLRQMVITGLTVRKVLWDFQEVSRKVPKRGPQGEVATEQKVETIRDTWTFEPVDLLTFHISDINIPYNDIKKARWIGEQYLVHKNYVKERCKKGWYSILMKPVLEDAVSASDSQSSNAVRDRLTSAGFQNISNKDKIEIIERWGLLEARHVHSPEELAEKGLEPDDMVESVVIIANRVAILKLEANPFWHNEKPYVVCPYIPKEFELPGIGIAQIGESLQEEINDTRNQTMDNKTLVLACMWLKERSSGIKNSELTIRPNGVIHTNNVNGLVPLRPPIVAGVGTNMEGIAKNDLRESAGASSNLQGIAQSGVDTATESSLINRESMGRLILTGQLFTELVLKPTLVFAEYLNYQFYDHVKVIKIIGKAGVKFLKLTPDEIWGGHKDVDIRIALDSTENPSIMRQQFMGFLTNLQQLPPPLIAFHWKSLDKAYGMFFPGHSLEELYPAPAPDPSKLLSPEEERDMVLAEQPIVAARGQDHVAFIEYHENEMASMQYSLSEIQFNIYKKLIMSHYELLMVETQEQAMAMEAEIAQEDQKQGNMNSKGKSANSSPNTQSKRAPSVESQRKELGA
jgi:hypothetical protein